MEDDIESLKEWVQRIRSSNNPLRQLHAFSIGVAASTLHGAAESIAEIESDGAEEISSVISIQADALDRKYKEVSGE